MATRARPKENAPAVKWFIEGEPGNEFTNEVLAREISEEMAHRDKICADGKPHNLWECSLEKIKGFRRMRKSATFLRFKEWVQIGDGPVQRFVLYDWAEVRGGRQNCLAKKKVKKGAEPVKGAAK